MGDAFAVLEGGGVKGIAHVGALARFQEEEPALRFIGYAGTSAGAIVASLAAVGYRALNPDNRSSSLSPHDLNMVMEELNFSELLGDSPVPFNRLRELVGSLRCAIPRMVELSKDLTDLMGATTLKKIKNGSAFLHKYQTEFHTLSNLQQLLHQVVGNKGVYGTHNLLKWLNRYLNNSPLLTQVDSLFARRCNLTFESLYNNNNTTLKIVATYLGDVKPRVYGPVDSRNIEIASAVQASISIPLFFYPFPEGSRMLVDGGLRSNYPLWIFDKERQQASGELIPIVGFRFNHDDQELESLSSVEDYVWELVNAALEGAGWLQWRETSRVVEVPIRVPAHVHATSFDLDSKDRELLFHRGYTAASAVLLQPKNRAILGLD